jgi:hypothetical protein
VRRQIERDVMENPVQQENKQQLKKVTFKELKVPSASNYGIATPLEDQQISMRTRRRLI